MSYKVNFENEQVCSESHADFFMYLQSIAREPGRCKGLWQSVMLLYFLELKLAEETPGNTSLVRFALRCNLICDKTSDDKS